MSPLSVAWGALVSHILLNALSHTLTHTLTHILTHTHLQEAPYEVCNWAEAGVNENETAGWEACQLFLE